MEKKFTKNVLEFAEKYLPISGKMMVEASGDWLMPIFSLLSDCQEMLGYNEHYREVLNDMKCALRGQVESDKAESASFILTIQNKVVKIAEQEAEIKRLKKIIDELPKELIKQK